MNQSKAIITALALSFYILYLIWAFLINGNFYLQQQMLFEHIFLLLIVCLFVKKRSLQLPSTRTCILISLICCVGFLSVHSSDNYLKSSIKMKLDLSIMFALFLLYSCFKDYFKKYLLLFLCVLILPWLLISWTTYSEMYVLNGTEYVLRRWDFTYYKNVRHFSYHVFIAFCISYTLFRYSYNKRGVDVFTSLPLFLLCAYSLLLLCLAAGRASLLSIVLFVFLWAIFNASRVQAVRDALLLVTIIIVIYILLIYTPFYDSSNLILGKFAALFHELPDNRDRLDAFSNGRIGIWKDALVVALESPVYGHGAASYEWLSFRFNSRSIISNPHNAVIQFIVEYGYLGAILILAVFYSLLKKIYGTRNFITHNKELYYSLLALLFSFLFYAQLDGLLFHSLPMLYFCLIVTVLASICGFEEKKV